MEITKTCNPRITDYLTTGAVLKILKKRSKLWHTVFEWYTGRNTLDQHRKKSSLYNTTIKLVNVVKELAKEGLTLVWQLISRIFWHFQVFFALKTHNKVIK